MKLLSIDGIMGAGKSYLFNLLKENFTDNKKIGFVEESVEKFKKYLRYNPLREYYSDPVKNAAVCQHYFLNVLGKLYSENLHKTNDMDYLISERNLYSTVIFINAQYERGYLTDFQHDYLTDRVHEKIGETLNKDCGLDCNMLVYVVTDVERCLERILQRKEESTMIELRDYLHCLQKEYDEYYHIFVEQNGSDRAEELTNIDEDEVLVRKVERLLRKS